MLAKQPKPQVFQSAKDRPPADLSFLKKRRLPRFSRIARVVPPASPSEASVFLADDFDGGSIDVQRWKTQTGTAAVVQGGLRLKASASVICLADLGS